MHANKQKERTKEKEGGENPEKRKIWRTTKSRPRRSRPHAPHNSKHVHHTHPAALVNQGHGIRRHHTVFLVVLHERIQRCWTWVHAYELYELRERVCVCVTTHNAFGCRRQEPCAIKHVHTFLQANMHACMHSQHTYIQNERINTHREMGDQTNIKTKNKCTQATYGRDACCRLLGTARLVFGRSCSA